MKIVIEGNTIDGSARSTLNVVLSGARGPQGPQGEAGASEWGDIGGTLSNQTDLQSALDAKVPYTGATQDVNLGEFGLLTGNVEFDTTPTNAPTAAGSMYYDDTSGTVVNILKGGNVISKIGETQHVRVYNNTGAPIAKGKVVAINGAQGQRPTIILADADSETLSKDTIGFTAEAIADGAEGFVMIAGVLTNVSTSGMVDGDTVYLSTTAGGYTNVKPDAPVHMVILGFVVNGGSGGAGQIYVKVDNGYELEELHNIKDTAKTTAVDADALLLKDSEDSNLWKPFSWLNAKAGIKAHMDTFKGVAGGYASLDGGGKVPASELPSYVDDVVEVANYATLPVTGETGKIYVTLDDNKCYRWSGSVYIQVAQGIDTLTTTGTSGAATLVGSTLNIPQYQSVLTNPVTGTGSSGQVAYWNGTNTQTGSANLTYNSTTGTILINSVLNNNASHRVGLNVTSNATTRIYINTTGTNAGFTLSANSIPTWTVASYGVSNNFTFFNEILLKDAFFITGAENNVSFGHGANLSARVGIRGSGTTSATTALLVQNSASSELFKVADNGAVSIGTGAADGSLLLTNSNDPNNTSSLILKSAISNFGTMLDIRPTGTSSNLSGFYLRDSETNASGSNIMLVGRGNATLPSTGVSYIGNIVAFQTNGNSLHLGFLLSNSTNLRFEAVRMWNTGNVLVQTAGTYTDTGAKFTVRGSGTTSATTALLVQNSTPTANFTIRDDGGYAFRGGTVGVAQTGYTTFTNLTTDRTCDANATTVEELADILGTLIEDLKTKGIISA